LQHGFGAARCVSAGAHFFDQGSQPRFERAAAGVAHFERQAEACGDGGSFCVQLIVIELRQIHHARVIVKVIGSQLRVPV
jgi:hypothetical protein